MEKIKVPDITTLTQTNTAPSIQGLYHPRHDELCGIDLCQTCIDNAGTNSGANPHCPKCGSLGYFYGVKAGGYTNYGQLVICDGQDCYASFSQNKAFSQISNMMTFDSYKPVHATEKKAMKCCEDFVNVQDNHVLLVLYGAPGRGKTHLAWAVRNYLKKDYKLFSGLDVLEELKKDFGKVDGTVSIELKTVQYLILDDLKIEYLRDRSTWAIAELERIIDARFQAWRKTMITTNADPDQVLAVSPALYSRFMSIDQSYCQLMAGRDHRTTKGG